MKTQITNLMLAISLVAIALLTFAQFTHSTKIAYVDTEKLLGEFNGMKEAQTNQKSQIQKWENNLAVLVKTLEQQKSEFQKIASSLNPKEKIVSEKNIKEKEQQIVQYKNSVFQKAQKEDAKMMDEILLEINSFLKVYAAENGYDLILATHQGNIAYGNLNLDITDKVLEQLNSN